VINELSRILQNIRSAVNIKQTLNTIILLFLINPGISIANNELNGSVIDEILARAVQKELADHSAWYDLLHYKQHMFSGFHSQVDDDAFFLSKQGKHDAVAELSATIKAFFSDKETQHPQCLFPARLHWLNEQLDFRQFLPKVSCHKFESWKAKVDVDSITMLFPSMYLHNPGSMFGHTFLRLNKKGNSDLLNYTLSYAAAYDPEDSMLSYVYKGISGGYTGVFSVQPYYETVQSYGDIEQRDIWEYALNLNQQEVDQLVRHIWEVSTLKYDYYFFRENCSYRLLSLLDVARPGLNITRDNHLLYAIPVDTVRSSRQASLIESEIYRPARSARIEQMFSQMNVSSRKKTLDVLYEDNFDLNGFSNNEQARILETAHEISQLDEEQGVLAEKILSARSRVPLENSENLFVYNAPRPDTGHDSARWNVAYGENESDQYTDQYIEIGLRPSFHDLLDREQGFVKGAAITVLDTRARWYENKQKLQLEYLSFFSMTSLSPVKPWGNSLSGRLNLVVQREAISSQLDAKVFNIDTALGYSFEWGGQLFYGLVDSQLSYTKKYEHDYIFSLGAEVGALFLFENSRMQFRSRFLYDVAGEERDKEKHEWLYQYDISKNHGLRLAFSTSNSILRNIKNRDQDAQINYLMYF
jgi:Domain of unknown function (DUF4105)